MKFIDAFIKIFIKPVSQNSDQARREFILNILLLGAVLLTGIAFIANSIYFLSLGPSYKGLSPFITLGILIFFSLLLFLSRKNKSRFTAYIFVILLFILSVFAQYTFGPDLPEGLLLDALIIVFAGILINSFVAFLVSSAISIIIIFFSELELMGAYVPQTAWKLQPFRFTDIIVNVISLMLIFVVSWMFNRELVQALKRARKSEKELRQQRDLLEEKVEERTEELKQAQLEKVSQLYKFAEFGRLSSGILHDLVTPLTSVSLNLSLLTNRSKKINKQQIIADQELLEKVSQGVTRMELFVKSVRKQLQKQEVRYSFNVVEEIKQVLQVFHHRLDEFGIKIVIEDGKNVTAVGNPIKFNQIISNIINNSINAYDSHKIFISKNKKIVVRIRMTAKQIQIEVQDFGCGIPKEIQRQIFKPLFTTKGVEKGTGIGLYITKEIVEKDFFGKISFVSNENEGTTFIIKIPQLEL